MLSTSTVSAATVGRSHDSCCCICCRPLSLPLVVAFVLAITVLGQCCFAGAVGRRPVLFLLPLSGALMTSAVAFSVGRCCWHFGVGNITASLGRIEESGKQGTSH